MINKLLKSWPRRLFLSKISWFMITATGIFIIIITLISVYDRNVGGLLVALDYKSQNTLSLCESENFEDATSVLVIDGIGQLTHASYCDIPELIEAGSGVKSDTANHQFFAYSFFLKNCSTSAISHDVKVSITGATCNIDAAVRIMLIGDDKKTIYAKAKSDGTAETHFNDPDPTKTDFIEKEYATTPFLGDGDVCSYIVPFFDVNAIKKYTVVVWLEGWDAECVNNILGGVMQLSIEFCILGNN